MCFLDQLREFGLGKALVLNMHLYGDTKPSAIAWSDAHGTDDGRLGGILFVLLRDKVQRAAKTGRITGGKKMLRSSSPRFSWPTHLLWNREIGAYYAVA
jgi:hypothetical protein